MEKINIDDFKKLEIKIGKILKVEKIEKSEKLLKLQVDFKEEKPRQVLSGIAKYFKEISELEGRVCAFATNLEPREMMGMVSEAMLLAVSINDKENKFSTLNVEKDDFIGLNVL